MRGDGHAGAADARDLLIGICHAFASTTDPDQAIESSLRWIATAVGTSRASIRLLLIEQSGRLRTVARTGPDDRHGRLRSSRRRVALREQRPVIVRLRDPVGWSLRIHPLLARGESLGFVEVTAPAAVFDARAGLLDAVASHVAAVLRNVRQRAELERAILGMTASVELARELLRARTAAEAVRSAVRLCHRHLGVPVVGIGLGPPIDDGPIVAIRGLSNARRVGIRALASRSVDRLRSGSHAEFAGSFAASTALANVLVLPAGNALLVTGSVSDRPSRRFLEQVAGLLSEALDHLDEVGRAARRNADLDLSIAWTAHELRAPIVASRAVLEHVLESGRPNDADEGLLKLTRDELARLAEFVDPLLRWSAGRGTLRRRSIGLAELVREAANGCGLDGPERIRIRVDRELTVLADAAQLRGAIANVLRNALAYSPPGKSVDVEIFGTDGRAGVVVRDHGPGVPAGDREAIFDPFSRGIGHAHDRAGAGLGLFIARRVIEAHGGTVRVQPSRTGAEFCIELPMPPERRHASAS